VVLGGLVGSVIGAGGMFLVLNHKVESARSDLALEAGLHDTLIAKLKEHDAAIAQLKTLEKRLECAELGLTKDFAALKALKC